MLSKRSQKSKPISHEASPLHTSLSELIGLASAAKKLNFHNHKSHCSHHAGGHRSSIRGRGMEFDEVRCYQAGDDIRTIDWRVTARTNKTHTKLYQEERERPVMLLVDYSSSMYFGTRKTFKSIIAAKIATILAWTAVQHGDRLGGVIFSNTESMDFRPQSKKRSLLPILKALASCQPNIHKGQVQSAMLNQSLERLRRVIKPGSLIFIISDFSQFDEESMRHLARLKKHNAIFACRVTDPMESELPRPNTYSVSDGIHRLQFDSSSKNLRQQYASYYHTKHQQLKTALQHLNAPLLEFSTDSSPYKILHHTFGHTKVRGAY